MKQYNKLILLSLILLIGHTYLIAQHQIIIQISPPRCLSTASLRMWQARGDYTVLNEPFVSSYVDKSDRLPKDWFNDDTLKSFKQAEENILTLAEQTPVFAKCESYAFAAYIKTSQLLLKNSNVKFIFLLRNPHHALISLYKGVMNLGEDKLKEIDDHFAYIAGFQPSYEAFNIVRTHAIHAPTILLAEDLYTNPDYTARALCKKLAIPFFRHMLQWQNLGDAFTGKMEWQEVKKSYLTHYWHGAAIKSTGFNTPTQYELDNMGNPTFSEVKVNDRQACIQAYQVNKKYYDLHLEHVSLILKS